MSFQTITREETLNQIRESSHHAKVVRHAPANTEDISEPGRLHLQLTWSSRPAHTVPFTRNRAAIGPARPLPGSDCLFTCHQGYRASRSTPGYRPSPAWIPTLHHPSLLSDPFQLAHAGAWHSVPFQLAHAEGVADGSRRLSEAIPPVSRQYEFRPRQGSQTDARETHPQPGRLHLQPARTPAFRDPHGLSRARARARARLLC
jgi:hypothetical protein